MPHIDDALLNRLLRPSQEADVTLCWHGVQTRTRTTAGGCSQVVTRLVGHMDDVLPDGETSPEAFCFVLDIPMDALGLMKISAHFSDSMEGLTTDALESLMKDGSP